MMSLSKLSKKQNPVYKFRYFSPCGKCWSHCDKDESLILYCEICNKSFHRSCLKVSKKRHKEITKNRETFICSRQCASNLLSLSHVDNVDFFSALYGEGDFPCGKCQRDCLDQTPSISCSICDRWYHFECSNLTVKEFNSISYYFCSPACEICLLPFTEVETHSLIKDGILFDHGDIKPPKKKKREKLKRSSLKSKHYLSSKRVRTDHFLEIDCSYLDTNEVNDFFNSDNSFTIFQNNISSLNLNMHLIEEIFLDCDKKPDIMAFGETRLHENDDSPKQKGYHELERDDSPTDRGGVGFYVSEQINYKVRRDLSLGMDRVEDLWIELEIDKNSDSTSKSDTIKYVIGNIYRHPGSQYKFFCENLCKSLEILNQSKTKYILLGDYNIDMLKYSLASDVTNYTNSLNSVGCNVLIDKPTRIEKRTATCIDHVYSNLPTDRLCNRIVMSDASDHFSILTKVSDAAKPNEKNQIYYRRSKLSSQEWQQFNDELKSTLRQKLAYIDEADPNFSADCITNTYHSLIEKFMPIRTLSRKQKRFFNKPWITKGIRISIKTKNKMFKLSKRSSEPSVVEKYREYRNLLTRIKIKAKNSYYADLAIQYGNDKSKIWRLVKEITKRKRVTKNTIKTLIDKDGQKLHDPKLITNSLNEHFSTVGKKMASKFSKSVNAKDALDYVNTDVKEHLVLSATNVSEILKLIMKLNDNKSSGYDSISNKILKATSNVIAPFIVELFNSCIHIGVFPDCFKKAQVVPLFKGGEKDSRSCYRPISLLPALGKLFEKVVSIRTTEFLNKKMSFQITNLDSGKVFRRNMRFLILMKNYCIT